MAAKPSLEQLLEGIDSSRLSQPCKDHHLSEVALHITEWQSIAPFLRLKQDDEEQIVTKCSNDLRAQKIAMLRRWKEKRGHKATYQELTKVFWKLGKLTLVEVVCEVLKDDYSSSESEGETEQGCVEGSGSQRWTVPRYASYLKGRYRTTRPPVLSLQWPPPPTRTVFNLALIQKERLEFGPNEELVRLLQRGQVREAAESQTEIELSNLMRADEEERKVVLIEGAPGSGKSTLAWHICQQWEKGELFTEYEVVMFVQLRDLKVQSATTIADILPIPSQAPSHDIGIAIASLLTGDNRCGKGVLLVLDGWDELQPDCPAHSLLMELIQIPDSLDMHFSSLIITSRPVTSGELQPHASSRVEVLGFKPEEVQEYFKTCFVTDHQLYARFVTQLRERPVIEASCFLPLNAVIVVHTFLSCNHSLPHTLHGVFEELVLSCITRHVTGRGEAKEKIKVPCLNDLPPDIEAPLSALASLAFHGIWVNKIVFSERDLNIFKLPVDLSTSLSLVQEVETIVLRTHSKFYNFFHLQIQELLAAYHISKVEENEQVKIFKDLFGQPRFAAVFQFYAAFSKLRAQGIREVLAEMINTLQHYLETILPCIYEAQDPSLCTLFQNESNRKNAVTFFLSSISDPLYTIALGYFLYHYRYYCLEDIPVSIYGFINFKLLVKEFLQHQSLVTATSPQCHACAPLKFTLYPRMDQDWKAFIQCASELVSSLQPFIVRLEFNMENSRGKVINTYSMQVDSAQLFGSGSSVDSITEPDRRFVCAICSSKQLRFFTVEHLNLHISLSALKVFCSAMATNSSIQYLTLRYCHFHLTGPASPLLHAIPLSNHLKVIDLTGTSLGGCVSFLLMGLASNTSVVELILKGCGVDLTGPSGQALSIMLRTNTTLRALNLRYNSADDLQAVCIGLTLNTSLAYLDLSLCQLTVTEESGPALANMLQTNTTLKSLTLDVNPRIFNEGAVYLAQGLAWNRGLETLSIGNCKISTAVVELAEVLKTNKCLLSLDISSNNVGERFVHIVKSLQVNSTLRHLRARRCGIRHNALLDIAGSSLESLDLSDNTIGDEGAAHIAQLVTNSRSLYQLSLEECGIGDRGAECLASALEVNTSLEILHIPGTSSYRQMENNISDTGLLALGRSLKRNKALKTLNVADCGTPAGRKQFVLSLCENEYLTYLRLSRGDEVSDEVSDVNRIRKEKNRSTLSTFWD